MTDDADADFEAAMLPDGATSRLHKGLASNVSTETAMSIVATHVMDLLFETAKACNGGALKPGQFPKWAKSAAAMVERGEHRRGASQ